MNSVLDALAVVAFVAVPAAHVGLRRYAERLLGAALPRVEKVHRLRRAMAASSLAALGLGWGVAAAAFTLASGTAATVLAGVTALLSVLALPVGVSRALRPAYRRLRGITARPPHRWRRVLIGLLWGLLFGTAIGVGSAAIPRSGWGHLAGVGLLWPAALLLGNAVLAPLTPVAVGARPLPPPQEERFRRLAAATGVRVAGIRVMPTRSQRQANAMTFGVVPGLRYILLTDYLLDALPSDQVDAVVAHELGHLRGHHVAGKLLVTAAGLFLLDLGVGAVTQGQSRGAAPVIGVAILPLAYLLSQLLFQGLLGLRLERRADDAAARCVGASTLARALEAVAELNDTKRDTGRGWAVLTQHPGLDERVRRLSSPATPRAATTHGG